MLTLIGSQLIKFAAMIQIFLLMIEKYVVGLAWDKNGVAYKQIVLLIETDKKILENPFAMKRLMAEWAQQVDAMERIKIKTYMKEILALVLLPIIIPLHIMVMLIETFMLIVYTCCIE